MIHVLNGGCMSSHTNGFRLNRSNGFPHYVLLNIHSKVHFLIAQKEFSIESGTMLLISPGTPYEYESLSSYSDDWLHFDILSQSDESISINAPIFSSVTPNVPILISHSDLYTTLFKQILWENTYSPDEMKGENISALFQLIISHLSYDSQHSEHLSKLSPYHSDLQAIRLEMKNCVSLEHSIQEYAEKLSVSPSYFQHIYKEQFGISFQKDLIGLRIAYAKELLSSSASSVKDIAEACGYHNEVHFHRQFREYVGQTPAEFRKTEHF